MERTYLAVTPGSGSPKIPTTVDVYAVPKAMVKHMLLRAAIRGSGYWRRKAPVFLFIKWRVSVGNGVSMSEIGRGRGRTYAVSVFLVSALSRLD